MTVTLSAGEPVTGFVHTKDEKMGILMVRKKVVHSTLASELRMIMAGTITDYTVDEAESEPPINTRKTSKRALEKRERDAMFKVESAISELNDKASPEGQTVFDSIHKTMDCKWVDGESITVLDQVRIDPPYMADNLSSLDGDEDAFNRIKKILDVVRSNLGKGLDASAISSAVSPPGLGKAAAAPDS